MKIERLILENFKRFTKLTIDKIPETARLVLLVGPNGSGKSSVFNAISYALTGETLQGLSNNIENVYGNKEDC